RPDLFSSADGRPAAAALNEVGGYSMTVGGRRLYAVQVAEKGIIWSRLTATGTTGHGSMPHSDNAAIQLADAVARLAAESHAARVTPVVGAFLRVLGLGELAEAAARGDGQRVQEELESGTADPVLRRSLNAMLRDTVTPTVIRVGQKMNVIPGFGQAEIDVRTLPDTDQRALLEHLAEVAGDDVRVEAVLTLPAISWPADAEIVRAIDAALRRADPDGEPAPMMITPGTDAKALAMLDIPTYGFAPLRLDPDVPFLSLFHGHDERVPVSAIAFGLPVLHEVVRGFVSAD